MLQEVKEPDARVESGRERRTGGWIWAARGGDSARAAQRDTSEAPLANPPFSLVHLGV